MIGDWNPLDGLYNISPTVDITFYGNDTTGNKGETGVVKARLQISENGKANPGVYRAPQDDVDIAILEITGISRDLKLETLYQQDTNFLVRLKDARSFVTYGSHVFTIGYPTGITSFFTNQPVVKSGFIASSLNGDPGLEQAVVTRRNDSLITVLDAETFLIDGGVTYGNSGGPVVLSQKPAWSLVNGKSQLLSFRRNAILGIVSHSFDKANISVIYSSDYILDILKNRR